MFSVWRALRSFGWTCFFELLINYLDDAFPFLTFLHNFFFRAFSGLMMGMVWLILNFRVKCALGAFLEACRVLF